jgi:hypothetical protein
MMDFDGVIVCIIRDFAVFTLESSTVKIKTMRMRNYLCGTV